MNKKWIVFPEIEEDFRQQFPEINPIVLQLLFNRGLINQKEIDEFLSPEYSKNLNDPFLFTQMEKGVKRAYQALKKNEKVLVYGDYDADGVTSSVILLETLKELGFKDVSIHLPDRETEGYGLNAKTIERYAGEGVNLIITVDCGVSNNAEIRLAHKLGIDVIVTDHHSQPLELPDKAIAIINPKVMADKYPFRELAGVGVAFKFCQGLLARQEKYLGARKIVEGWEKWFLDLVALGTIADLMPLIGENRTLVKYGLMVLNKTRRLGLQTLFKQIGLEGKDLNAYNIGFQIGPRINAAGRMEHADIAVSLLVTDSVEHANKIAENLDNKNKERRSVIDKILRESEKQILDSGVDANCLILLGDNWPIGVVGLVAGRLMDSYYRPVLVISNRDGELTGSGRSIAELNIVEILQSLEKYLAHYGGHPRACGFTLKDENMLEDFRRDFSKCVDGVLKDKILQPTLEIDAEIKLEHVNWELQEEIEKFEPFGQNNSTPIFLIKDLEIDGMAFLGKTENHLRLMVKQGAIGPKKMLGFFMAKDWGSKIKIGDHVDAIVEISVNQWNGTRELEFRIVDLKIN
ncbi:MAG: single-stranded-DNA-specific exonuclease RecJ [Patescibacteria group bacterium]